MKFINHLIALLAIAALASYVNASDGVRIGGSGMRIDMVPTDPNATSATTTATANCNVRLNKHEVVLHWESTPFTHVSRPEFASDAYLAATVTQKIGQLAVSPSRAVDHTDLADGDSNAAVAMGIRGNGKLSINLEVGIEDDNAVAGRHCATVIMTVTGH
jgi:hypothetical protein